TPRPVVGPRVQDLPPPLAPAQYQKKKTRPMDCSRVLTFSLSHPPVQNPKANVRLVAGPRFRLSHLPLAPALHIEDKGCYVAACLVRVVVVPLQCSICRALKSIFASTVNRTLSTLMCLVHVAVVLLQHTWSLSVVKSILASTVAQALSTSTLIRIVVVLVQCPIRDSF
ncbi:hypothetical protein EV363DRAFT_1168701, partial [Boletus edulis]